ncbi:MAG: energy-coupling factor transporter ATPase [Treponema sp.]|nr:energy-coupling factor transporter ATPase [Treponema sp.]
MMIVNFENVSYKYPRSEKFALSDVSITIEDGEFLAVMGENGAGKTTFCRIINGLIPHMSGGTLSGNVIVDGQDVKRFSVPEMALKVGMVLDDPEAQLFAPTVRLEAAFGPENLLLSPEEIEERVKFALASAGLSGFEERIPSTLSGGEKQRLAVAAALAMKEKILVLDEPLCRLDPRGVTEVMSVLNDIKLKYGITIIMAAHNSSVMAEYADRVCVLKNGKIAALDTAKNIFENSELLEENGIELLNRKGYEGAQSMLSKTNSSSVSSVVNSSLSIPLPAVNIKDFCFNYPGGVSIENINLSILENDFAAIIGDNGCGKTTLLKSIAGLLRPSSGDIFIRGKNTKELSVSEISKYVGFVTQNPDTQLFTDTVYKEVTFALKNKREKGKVLSKDEIKKRAEDALMTAGITDTEAFPHSLSRSDRTRVVIACVLAMGSKIILFDEIDAGNDYKGTLQIMEIAKDLNSKGFTIIFVTHNLNLAERYANKIITMNREQIAENRF